MVELKLTDGKSPVLFTANGYRLVVMPMLTAEAREEENKRQEQKPDNVEAETEGKETETAESSEPKKTNVADRRSQ